MINLAKVHWLGYEKHGLFLHQWLRFTYFEHFIPFFEYLAGLGSNV